MSTFIPRKFEALVDEFGKDDYGVASGTFDVQSIKKGKIYLEENPKFIDSQFGNTGVIIDDNACWHRVSDRGFSKKFKEVKS